MEPQNNVQMKLILQLTSFFLLVTFIPSCQKEYLKSEDDTANIFIYDADAKIFIDSAGISDSTQKLAINNLVIQLKDSLLWSSFTAIYPMIGGTETTTKWNLKDPRNLDAAYRLTFYGKPVYANTGVLFPTKSDFADTHLNDTQMVFNNNAISYYSRTQNTISGYDMGCLDSKAPFTEMAIYHESDATDYFGYYKYGYTPTNTIGLFMLSATAGNVTWYENGLEKFLSNKPPVMAFTGYPMLLGWVVNAASGGRRECAFATIGKGLSAGQALTFYNIVKNFETTLVR